MKNKILLQVNVGDGEHKVWLSMSDAGRAIAQADNDYSDDPRAVASNISKAVQGVVPTAYGSAWIVIDAAHGLDTGKIKEIVARYRKIKRIEEVDWKTLDERVLDQIIDVLDVAEGK